jgi:hypothetical protein
MKRVGLHLLVTVSILIVSLHATPIPAYNLLTKGGACPDGFKFPANADLDVNISTAPDGIAQYLIGAVGVVSERIGRVGGQSFNYNNINVVFDTLAVGDSDGRNDVGLADLTGSGAGAMGPAIVDTSTCETLEANVLINKDNSWEYFDPNDQGYDYYNVNEVMGGKRYLMPALLHELGHNLSLAHSTDTYTHMNAATSSSTARPWSNRRDDKRIEPLPDMRRALRSTALYGNGGTETDLAALVTWFDDSTGASPAPQKLLCHPSAGTAFSPRLFDISCGVDSSGNPGSRDVCIGEHVYTRVALPNYGTSDMEVEVELWFSADDILNRTTGADIQSPTVKMLTISAGTSARKGYTFEIPSGLTPGSDYFPIMFVNSGALLSSEESQQNNWIPLRRTITVQSCP